MRYYLYDVIENIVHGRNFRAKPILLNNLRCHRVLCLQRGLRYLVQTTTSLVSKAQSSEWSTQKLWCSKTRHGDQYPQSVAFGGVSVKNVGQSCKYASWCKTILASRIRIISTTAWKLLRFCHKKCLCHKKTSEPFGISQSICTRTLRNLTRYLHRNPPEPHQAYSPPKPSGTSQSLCTGTFRNLTKYLPRNPPEPHHASSPRPSGERDVYGPHPSSSP